ncbi:adenosylhomocysteinase [Adlercreutzia sp. ZJ154]|uniref:adenosylhomocysteinase n=1 Tax=Adlercreutzia sp. ZJ154 TaxID=2709790 RepID=UPI0013E9F87A|nr:adenosylhomocysteinase [Adlercreutzia sp. ZJ154]
MRDCDIKDIALADAGRARIEWADRDMPVLALIRKRFEKERPLEGVRIGACLHVTTETANLMRTLVAGGADVRLCASNPLSTQDDTAAALVRDYGVSVYAICGEDNETYYKHIDTVIDFKPQITMDDGGDVVGRIHEKRREALQNIIGGTEETTTGVIRLAAMAAANELEYPVIAVNDAKTKHFFDNRYGTGQSTLDGVIRLTNRLLAGRTLVVSGYGWCGKGLAMRAKGMGCKVVVCEVDATAALEAYMDGFEVMPREQAAKVADIWITVTGNLNVIDDVCFENMKDGAIICNSGHFNSEINIPWLEEHAIKKTTLKPLVDEYTMPDGRTIILLAEGRLVNLSGAEGHPANVMDMSFANHALCAEYLLDQAKDMQKKVYDVPEAIDERIAQLKLEALGVHIDTLTPAQVEYMNSWQIGTV